MLDDWSVGYAWIAGPVVGCVAAILLIALGAFLVSRRRKRKKVAKETTDAVEPKPESKPELHSDPSAIYELGDHHVRPELIGDETRWELPANERSHELSIDYHTGSSIERNVESGARAPE